MASENFDQDGMASEALDFEELVLVIGGAENRDLLPENQIRFLFRLAREQTENHPDDATGDGDGRHRPADPSRVAHEGGESNTDTGNTQHIEKCSPPLERHVRHETNPESDRDREETERQNTETDSTQMGTPFLSLELRSEELLTRWAGQLVRAENDIGAKDEAVPIDVVEFLRRVEGAVEEDEVIAKNESVLGEVAIAAVSEPVTVRVDLVAGVVGSIRNGGREEVVAQGGLEPPTPQFSVECSTN